MRQENHVAFWDSVFLFFFLYWSCSWFYRHITGKKFSCAIEDRSGKFWINFYKILLLRNKRNKFVKFYISKTHQSIGWTTVNKLKLNDVKNWTYHVYNNANAQLQGTTRLLEPNTYECPIRTIKYVLGWNSHFWLKNELLSPIRTNGYDSQNLTGIYHPPSENL